MKREHYRAVSSQGECKEGSWKKILKGFVFMDEFENNDDFQDELRDNLLLRYRLSEMNIYNKIYDGRFAHHAKIEADF